MSQITRRTLARGAAWSVPVVAFASAAPASAASGSCSVSDVDASLTLTRSGNTSVHVILVITISGGTCDAGQTDAIVSFDFDLTAPYTSWISSGTVPSEGAAPATVSTQITLGFNGTVESTPVTVLAYMPAGSVPAPITFTVSAEGAQTKSVTATFD